MIAFSFLRQNFQSDFFVRNYQKSIVLFYVWIKNYIFGLFFQEKNVSIRGRPDDSIFWRKQPTTNNGKKGKLEVTTEIYLLLYEPTMYLIEFLRINWVVRAMVFAESRKKEKLTQEYKAVEMIQNTPWLYWFYCILFWSKIHKINLKDKIRLKRTKRNHIILSFFLN